MLINIDFLSYKNKLTVRKNRAGKLEVYDIVRRKYIILQPEEMVRQLVIHYLISEKNAPLSKMRVEMGLTVNELSKRCDILVFDNNVHPFFLVECKAATVKIDQSVFEQIARYNLPLQVPYLMVTNGLTTYCCRINEDKLSWQFLSEIPLFKN
ncbi:MAG: type I restriction enzyme HsdR N-terminal domain-containing protein [Saprospiraceae bacterium]|nr:type I restriction enzyme HsdR N-terminal domain-containing protein [Saprospiraceae bacterium]